MLSKIFRSSSDSSRDTDTVEEILLFGESTSSSSTTTSTTSTSSSSPSIFQAHVVYSMESVNSPTLFTVLRESTGILNSAAIVDITPITLEPKQYTPESSLVQCAFDIINSPSNFVSTSILMPGDLTFSFEDPSTTDSSFTLTTQPRVLNDIQLIEDYQKSIPSDVKFVAVSFEPNQLLPISESEKLILSEIKELHVSFLCIGGVSDIDDYTSQIVPSTEILRSSVRKSRSSQLKGDRIKKILLSIYNNEQVIKLSFNDSIYQNILIEISNELSIFSYLPLSLLRLILHRKLKEKNRKEKPSNVSIINQGICNCSHECQHIFIPIRSLCPNNVLLQNKRFFDNYYNKKMNYYILRTSLKITNNICEFYLCERQI